MAKIVVAEDEPGISMLIALALRMEGHEVMQASDGRMALQMVRDERPDLLLLDVMMPHLSGYEVAQALQQDAETVAIPIIFVTAKGEMEDRLQGLNFATDYVSKPFAVPELLARVRAALRIHRLQEELRISNERLARLAVTDELTNLPNRRGFMSELESELVRARRFGHSVALLLFDLDRFKAVNDTWGHARGDAVLQQFAHVMEEHSRRADKIGRLGGEEFVALLPNTGAEGAAIFAEKVREATEETHIRLSDDTGSSVDTIGVTVSAGVVVFAPWTPTEKKTFSAYHDGAPVENLPEQNNLLIARALLRVADECLYTAKKDGRNRWVLREVCGVAELPLQEISSGRSRKWPKRAKNAVEQPK